MTTNYMLHMLFLVLFCMLGLPAQASATEYIQVHLDGGLMAGLRTAGQNQLLFTEVVHCENGTEVKKEESLSFRKGDVVCLPKDAKVDSKKVAEWFAWQGQELNARGKVRPATTQVVAKASPPVQKPTPKAPAPVKTVKTTPPPPASMPAPAKPVQIAKVVPPTPAPVAPKATPAPEPQKPLNAVKVGNFPTVAKTEAVKLPQLPTVKSAKLRPAVTLLASSSIPVVTPKFEKPKPVVITSAKPSNGPITVDAFKAITTGEGSITTLTQPTGQALPSPRPVEKTSAEIAAENAPKERPLIPGQVVPTCGTPQAKDGILCVDAPKERKGTGTFWENVGLWTRVLKIKQDNKPMVLAQTHKSERQVTLSTFEIAARMQPDGSLRPDSQPETQQTPAVQKAEIVADWGVIGFYFLFFGVVITSPFLIKRLRKSIQNETEKKLKERVETLKKDDATFWEVTAKRLRRNIPNSNVIATTSNVTLTVEPSDVSTAMAWILDTTNCAQRELGRKIGYTRVEQTDGKIGFVLMTKTSTAKSATAKVS